MISPQLGLQLSLVIPTHLRHQNISGVLESVREQCIPRECFEVLVVSNFEDPHLTQLVEQWTGKIAIRLLVANVLGVNSARNLGLKNCRGSIALFLDDDCRLPGQDYLINLCSLHQSFPEATAIGGAYLTPSGTGKVGEHYNWICNRWLCAQFTESRWTKNLIGGCVSYKIQHLRDRTLFFDERIRYGGSETEFHERLSQAELLMLFHPSLSVTHEIQMDIFDLVRKAFLQGFGKSRRKVRIDDEHADQNTSPWQAKLQGTVSNKIYSLAFSLGEKSGATGALYPPPPWNIYVRMLGGLSFDFLTRGYWLGYRFVSFAYAAIVRCYWFSYGLFHRLKGQIARTKSRLIRAFWTIYPLGHFLRRHWYMPHAVFWLKMPLTYPAQDTVGGPLWAASADSSLSPQEVITQAKGWSRLGIRFFEVPEHTNWSVGDLRALYAALCSLNIQLAHRVRFPQPLCSRKNQLIQITTSEILDRGPAILLWLSKLRSPAGLLILVQNLKRNDRPALTKFFAEIKKLPQFERYYVRMSRGAESACSQPFDHFRHFYHFALSCEELSLPWRAYYQFKDNSLQNYRLDLPASNLVRCPLDHHPQISVVIPHRQDLVHLKSVLKALSAQTLDRKHFEVIVVDNATSQQLISGRDTESLLAEYSNLSLSVFKLTAFKEETFLSGHARNQGIKAARGDSILFLDSDILLAPTHLELLLEELKTADVVMAKRKMLKQDVVVRAEEFQDTFSTNVYSEDDYWENFKRAEKWENLKDHWKYSCTYFFAVKRSALLSAGPFDPQFLSYGFEDVDLGFRLFKQGKRFAFSTQFVLHLFPNRKLHSFHSNIKAREIALSRSALILFMLRPERLTFALCQSYFAPTLGRWIRENVAKARVPFPPAGRRGAVESQAND